MKKIKQFSLVASLSVLALFSNNYSAKADTFGAIDAAQLAQQIAQYIQDLQMDIGGVTGGVFDKMDKVANNITQNTNKMTSIISKFKDAGKVVSTMRSITNSISIFGNALSTLKDTYEYSKSLLDGSKDWSYFVLHCGDLTTYYYNRWNYYTRAYAALVKEFADYEKSGMSTYETMKAIKDINDEMANRMAVDQQKMNQDMLDMMNQAYFRKEAANNYNSLFKFAQ